MGLWLGGSGTRFQLLLHKSAKYSSGMAYFQWLRLNTSMIECGMVDMVMLGLNPRKHDMM